jgi:hypothetical protein
MFTTRTIITSILLFVIPICFSNSFAGCHEFNYCPYCSKAVQSDWRTCPYCGKNLCNPTQVSKTNEPSTRETRNLALNGSQFWTELPDRACSNGQCPHVSPSFQTDQISWYLARPSNPSWCRAEIALKKTFSTSAIRFDFEFNWTGGGSIEIFICDATDITGTNWKPNNFYGVYISSSDTPYLQLCGIRDQQSQFLKSNIESSSNYKNRWVSVSIFKNGSEWRFYRNGNLLDSREFTVLNGKQIALIVAPSHNDYKGSDAKIAFRKIIVTPY